MKYNDLEKTQDLFDIAEEVPSPIETIEMEGASKGNLTDEFTLNLNDKDEKLEEIKKKNNNNSKKKIILLVGVLLILLGTIGGVTFFLLNDEEEPPKKEEPKKPQVIVEKENYIYKDGKLHFLDKDDNELGTYECENTSENSCYVVYYNDEDEFDIATNVYEDETLIERRSQIYLDNYVFIVDSASKTESVISLYNIEEEKIEGTYTLVKGYNNSDYVILKDEEGKYGAIEFTKEGIKEKMKFSFDYLGTLNKDSNVVAKTNNKYFIYTKEGKIVSKGLNFEIKSYNNEYIVVEDDGYYVYDYKGNSIFDEAYDYVSLLKDYVAIINNQKLYIKDYENNKYNENGITITNPNYNEVNIYNKDKELVETKKAFEININNDKMDITYYTKQDKEKSASINLLEGKLSKEYTYLNYFDGNLYFYDDEEESNLIGTYKCNNKNEVTTDTAFTNCLIASDTNLLNLEDNSIKGWIPVINKRYVFIVDAIDLNNPTIMLYDLKKKDVLSKYESIDTGLYTTENKLTLKTLEDTLYVLAKNKDKEFGVIKISEDIGSVIPFKYTKIEKLKDYYLAVDEDNKHTLFSNTGKELVSKINNKIIDYKNNYVLAQDKDNKMYIYDNTGKSLEATGYLHIAMYDDYYVVINSDKKLDIHKYNDSSFKLSSLIDIKNDTYQDSYEVTKTSTGYTIKIKSSNEVFNADLKGILDKDKVVVPEIPKEEDKPVVDTNENIDNKENTDNKNSDDNKEDSNNISNENTNTNNDDMEG